LSAAEEVDVEVGHGFPAVRAVVDGDAEAGFREAEIACDGCGGEKQVAEEGLVFRVRLADARDGLPRDDQDMGGCLRGNVPEGAAEIVLVDDFRRDLPVVDFLEKCLHGGAKMAAEHPIRKADHEAVKSHPPCIGEGNRFRDAECQYPQAEAPGMFPGRKPSSGVC